MAPLFQEATTATPTAMEEQQERRKLPPVCLLAVLESWIRSPAGMSQHGPTGFVSLEDAVKSCASLATLTGGTPAVLAKALFDTLGEHPEEGSFEYDIGFQQVRLRGLLERVRAAVDRGSDAFGQLSSSALLQTVPVTKILSGVPTVDGRIKIIEAAMQKTSRLRSDAPVYQPLRNQETVQLRPSAPEFVPVDAINSMKETVQLRPSAPEFVPVDAANNMKGTVQLSPSAPTFVPAGTNRMKEEADVEADRCKLAEDKLKRPSIQPETGNCQATNMDMNPFSKDRRNPNQDPQLAWYEPMPAKKPSVAVAPSFVEPTTTDDTRHEEEQQLAHGDCCSDTYSIEQGNGASTISEPESEASPTFDIELQVDDDTCKESGFCTSEFFSVQQLLHWRAAACPHKAKDAVHCVAQKLDPGRQNADRLRVADGPFFPSSTALTPHVKEVQPESRKEEGPTTVIQQNACHNAMENPSPTSWAAQQRERRANAPSSSASVKDETVVRTVKSILNKLTIEKFEQLLQQLMGSGITTQRHVELLIQELFAKATTQHHFIDMYADLCVRLNEHFAKAPVEAGTNKFSFKRCLVNQCHEFYEQNNLSAPTGLDELDSEERCMQEVRYKTRTLGNIKLIGALGIRRLLSSRIVVIVASELFDINNSQSLESVATLLTVVGPNFDRPESCCRLDMDGFMKQVRSLVHRGVCEPRIRCLLQDLLDLRSTGWNNLRPKRQERPTTLHDVAQQASVQEGPGQGSLQKPPARPQPSEAVTLATAPTPIARPTPSESASVGRHARNEEMRRTFNELRTSHDVGDAVSRLQGLGSLPPIQQTDDLVNWLLMVTQEGQSHTRKAGFKVIVELLLRGCCWEVESLRASMERMFADFHDLSDDVPGLCNILINELLVELNPLVKSGALSQSMYSSWLQAVPRITGCNPILTQ